MKDSKGVQRGKCKKCPSCTEYQPPAPGPRPGSRFKCSVCQCPAGAHENADSTAKATAATVNAADDGSVYTSSSGGPAKESNYLPPKMDSYVLIYTSRCPVLGCGKPVDFDVNTGMEYNFCGKHMHLPLQSASMVVQDIEIDQDGFGGNVPMTGTYQMDPSMASTATMFNTFNPFTSTAALPPAAGTKKCAISECPKPCYIDENGVVHQCCGRTHAKELEARSLGAAMPQQGATPLQPSPSVPPQSSSPNLPSSNKCAIAECPNPRYVDESGTIHECCGITHAMEHQRRLALMKQTNQQVVKGVTHCYLPKCNRPTWPFMNYCGKTHADLGKQRGLPPPPSLTSGLAAGSGAAVTAASATKKTSSMCLIPECTAPKYVDPNSGETHDFCGKSHAAEGKRRGIRSQAEKQEDQCDLPGCTNKKNSKGVRVFDYCCRDHAVQDAPNRAARVLTSHSEVQKFLNNFSNLKVVSLKENDHAKLGGTLFNRFKNAFDSLPKQHQITCLAFHGTAEKNIQSICANGYDPKLRSGQWYGTGEYFATTPDISMSYCKSGGKKMLLNELLLGQSGKHHTQHGNVIVMKNPDHDLPRYVITFR